MSELKFNYKIIIMTENNIFELTFKKNSFLGS